MDALDHNYVPKVLEAARGLPPGALYDCAVMHDDECTLYSTGAGRCDCDPEIKIIMLTPEDIKAGRLPSYKRNQP